MSSIAQTAVFETEYAQARKSARRAQVVGVLAVAGATLISAYIGGFFDSMPVTLASGERVSMPKLWAGLPRLGEYLAKTIPTLRLESLGSDLAAWFWRWKLWFALLGETVLIAYAATVLAVFGGFIMSFLAARNLSPDPWLCFLVRRYLEIIRTVPDLVWALIFVFCLGVGPLAGVLAIALHATGSLGKLYSEANENIDMRPLEGIKASGGSWLQQMRYGAVPQVIPNIISYTLLRFEINVRSSSIIGYVGAGGLGQEIRTAMSLQEYTDLSALFVIILATVMIIDFASEKLRHWIIGLSEHWT
ncbi:phosphonate ABC transporter, permease protein PhnE [Pseudochelatococcus sp. B33]